jgi:hypothetical protein
MDNKDPDNLEEFTERAKKILDSEDFQTSLLITTVLECPQSPEQSCLAPAYSNSLS